MLNDVSDDDADADFNYCSLCSHFNITSLDGGNKVSGVATGAKATSCNFGFFNGKICC